MQPSSFTDAPGLSGILLINFPTPAEPGAPVIAKRALLETIGHTLTEARNTTRLTAGDILFLRNELTMSQEKLSKLLGVPLPQWKEWESGAQPIDKSAEMLLRVFYRETVHLPVGTLREFLIAHAEYCAEHGDRPRGEYYMEYNSCAQDWMHISSPELTN